MTFLHTCMFNMIPREYSADLFQLVCNITKAFVGNDDTLEYKNCMVNIYHVFDYDYVFCLMCKGCTKVWNLDTTRLYKSISYIAYAMQLAIFLNNKNNRIIIRELF